MIIGILGTGIGGLRVAAELRARGFEGTLVAWDEEGEAPYDRPTVSKHLFDEFRRPLADQELGDLAELGVDVRTERVVSVSAEEGGWTVRAVRTGEPGPTAVAPQRLDALVVASGAAPVLTIPGALPLFSVADARRLRARVRPGRRIDVVGAGWLGTEIADAAARVGGDVHLWERSAHILRRDFHGTVDDIWRARLDAAGIRLHLGAPFPARAGKGEGAAVVVQATGARPAVGFMPAAVPRSPRGALAVDLRGRVVDDAGVAVPGLYAVGDASELRLADGRWRGGGHWTQVLGDAQRVAAELTGTEPPAMLDAPEVFSTQFGHEIGFVGEAPAGLEPTREERGGGTVVRWDGADGLVGLLAIDAPRELSRARRELRRPLPREGAQATE